MEHYQKYPLKVFLDDNLINSIAFATSTEVNKHIISGGVGMMEMALGEKLLITKQVIARCFNKIK